MQEMPCILLHTFSSVSVVDFQQLSTNLSNYWSAVKIATRQQIRPTTPLKYFRWATAFRYCKPIRKKTCPSAEMHFCVALRLVMTTLPPISGWCTLL